MRFHARMIVWPLSLAASFVAGFLLAQMEMLECPWCGKPWGKVGETETKRFRTGARAHLLTCTRFQKAREDHARWLDYMKIMLDRLNPSGVLEPESQHDGQTCEKPFLPQGEGESAVNWQAMRQQAEQGGGPSFPHCDQDIVHAPGTCGPCDAYPELQEKRRISNTNYTGESRDGRWGDPATLRRSLNNLEAWPRNRAVPPESGVSSAGAEAVHDSPA